MRNFVFLFFSVCLFSSQLYAQNSFKAIVKDSTTDELLIGVNVYLKSTTKGGVTGVDGLAEIYDIPDGTNTIVFSSVGYQKKEIAYDFPLSVSMPLEVYLKQDIEQLEEILVTTTRTNSRIEETPLKIEVLGLEEMNEESSFVPGNIASLLGDISSVQIQQTSPVSGNSVVRMQGLDGRYTLLLRDGIPSYGDLSGGLNILQIPPLDLHQIEIIKGPASTLNGGGAIAGLINFISKKPSDPFEADFILNQTTLKETNLNTYISGTHDKTAYTLMGAYTRRLPVDVDKDGYSDVPLLQSFLLHPQFYYDFDKYNQIKIGLTSSFEDRTGGDIKAIRKEFSTSHQYYNQTSSVRNGIDLFFDHIGSESHLLSFKSSINSFTRRETTNTSSFDGDQSTVYSELFYSMPFKNQEILFGTNYLLDRFRKHSNDSLPVNDYDRHTIGLFSQYSLNIEKKINFQAGLRADHNSHGGWFVLPSVAALIHTNRNFSFRINGGMGYKIPNALEISETSLIPGGSDILPGSDIQPERSLGGTLEWNYNKKFGEESSLFFNQTFFITRITDPILVEQQTGGDYLYENSPGTVTSKGIDNYVQLALSSWEIYVGYTYTIPKNSENPEQPYLTYTPLHRAALTLVYEFSEHWNAGVEASYNGYQYKDDGTKTQDYLFLAASVQYKTGPFTFVLNGENILDFRQTKFEQVVSGPPDRPVFSRLWAPVDGRVFNFSVLFRITKE